MGNDAIHKEKTLEREEEEEEKEREEGGRRSLFNSSNLASQRVVVFKL